MLGGRSAREACDVPPNSTGLCTSHLDYLITRLAVLNVWEPWQPESLAPPAFEERVGRRFAVDPD
jgi:hypothetical protein